MSRILAVRGRELARGKTKIICADLGNSVGDPEDPYHVLIHSTDNITSGDGERRHIMPGKGALSNRTSANCFRLLYAMGIPTHYVETVGEDIMRCRKVHTIPMEVVARRRATGSYVRRHPEVPEGTRFEQIVIEFFLKDDANHDPLVEYDFDEGVIRMYRPKDLPEVGLINESPLPSVHRERQRLIARVRKSEWYIKQVFIVLEEAWHRQDVELIDLKIELGYDAETDEIIVADTLDNDNWRLWKGGRQEDELSKQIYRNLKPDEITPEKLLEVREKFAWVAEATDRFVI